MMSMFQTLLSAYTSSDGKPDPIEQWLIQDMRALIGYLNEEIDKRLSRASSAGDNNGS